MWSQKFRFLPLEHFTSLIYFCLLYPYFVFLFTRVSARQCCFQYRYTYSPQDITHTHTLGIPEPIFSRTTRKKISKRRGTSRFSLKARGASTTEVVTFGKMMLKFFQTGAFVCTLPVCCRENRIGKCVRGWRRCYLGVLYAKDATGASLTGNIVPV